MVVSADITHAVGAELYLATTQQPQDSRTVASQSFVFQKNAAGDVVPTFSASYTYKAFGSSAPASSEGSFSRKKVYSVLHKPDIEFVAASIFENANEPEADVHKSFLEYLRLFMFKRPHLTLLEISEFLSFRSVLSTVLLTSMQARTLDAWLCNFSRL